MTTSKKCIDCPPESNRPAPYGGPRTPLCATHFRERKKSKKAAAHEKRVQSVYGLGPGDYDRLYKYQGGVCAICQKANGRTKKLAVDHDHDSGLARGLLCSTCNRILLGRYNMDSLRRAIEYLQRPPARKAGITAKYSAK